MLLFANPGIIDPRLITSMGVNVKEGSNPFGYFGTGLKNAIAILLRTGHSIEIISGPDTYKFKTITETIRGKDFEFVYMNDERLAYTTELGKNWEVWMAYRELRSNAIDEGGDVQIASGREALDLSSTYIFVEGEQIERTHQTRKEFWLESTPIHVCKNLGVEIHDGVTNAVFYRGIKVHTLNTPSQYTYNLLHPVDLTEDRTAKSPWSLQESIKAAIMVSEDEDFIKTIISLPKETYEGSLDYDNMMYNLSSTFKEIAAEAVHSHRGHVNESVRRIVDRLKPKERPERYTLRHVEQHMFDKALLFCKSIGYPVTQEVFFTESLGAGLLAMAFKGEIWISRAVLAQGTKQLASTLLEESFHIKYGYKDCTTQFQTFLFDVIMTLGEELQGSPL